MTKALFIVEGKETERKIVTALMQKLSELSSIKAEIVSISANIHMLYQKLRKDDFYLDVIGAVKEMEDVSDDDRRILDESGPFAYQYLVFDLDLQHYDISKQDNVQHGLAEVKELLTYFDDETDGTKGKLYINYPMVEAYRDCNSFFEKEFAERIVALEDCVNYKAIVGNRGNVKNIDSYSRDDCRDLICINLYKLNYIVRSMWEKPDYDEYSQLLTQNDLFEAERKMIGQKRIISVINTLMMFPIDYLGNWHGYYRNLRPR